MKPAHRAAMPIEGQALPGDLGIEAVRRELLLTPDARAEGG